MAIPFFKREPDNIEIPPTAIVERSNGKMELPDVDRRKIEEIERSGMHAREFLERFNDLKIRETENTLRLESERRQNGELRVKLAQEANDKQTLQSQIESQRQEIADLRAVLSNITLQLHHARIPLPPVWELLRQNQEPNHASPLGTIDRPASTADRGAGSPDPAA